MIEFLTDTKKGRITMKRTLFFVLFSVMLATELNAGLFSFLGDVASTAIGGSLASRGNNGSGGSSEATLNSKNIKIQEALKIMEYYKGESDGNLNTFDSRFAIETFQKDFGYMDEKKGFLADILEMKSDFHPGILDKFTTEDLIYFYELANEFDNTMLSSYISDKKLTKSDIDKYVKRKQQLLSAAKRLEKSLSKNSFVNTKLSQQMASRLEKEQRKVSELIDAENIYFAKLIWEDQPYSNKLYNYKEAQEYCKNLKLYDLKWRTPTLQELRDIYNNSIEFKNIPPKEYGFKDNYYYWSSDENSVVSDGENYYTGEPNSKKHHVRCVSTY